MKRIVCLKPRLFLTQGDHNIENLWTYEGLSSLMLREMTTRTKCMDAGLSRNSRIKVKKAGY